MLGAEGDRSYLVVFMNNAELRGAGGLPSGIGTLHLDNGRIDLGEFEYIGELTEPHPYRRVAAPDDFDRRFGEFYADTTLWSNLTLSPDLPDVAVVADRLYQLKRQQSSDGVLFVDPRGLQVLMPAGSSVATPNGQQIDKANLTDFIYEDAYQNIQDPQLRRQVMLLFGHAIFELITEQGIGDLTELGAAVAGGHLRFVPFEVDEAELMAETGASGDLTPPEIDGLLATVQATAAHKLDYYVDRSVTHRCDVTDDMAACGTSVELRNDTPEGLSDFAAPEEPYGLLQNFLEIYVPRAASVTSVRRDGETEGFIRNRQDGYTSVGFDLELERDAATTVTVAYEIELDAHRYELIARPQPLARDATLELELDFPADWAVFGPGSVRGATLSYSGVFNGTIEVRARLKQRSGISLAWERLAGFMNEPLF
ncbi:MAG: DUF4012 domain-containing protein [Actinobacteria bacterium]|nr:DUF4012 domain-containing protein [Actinomycetota bacterium]